MPCARSTADVGSQQGRQGITTHQPCFQSAEVATPGDWSDSAESSVAAAQASPSLQPAAAEAQEPVQLLLSLHRQHLRPERSESVSPGKENHGSNGRRATLFSQNTLAGRLKAAASCSRVSSAALQHAPSRTQQAAACAGDSVEQDTSLPGPAERHEYTVGCGSLLPGWHVSRVQRDGRRLDEAAGGRRSVLQHASSAPDQRPCGGMDTMRRFGSEPHKSEIREDAGQCKDVTQDEAARSGMAMWCATSAPAQHASTGDAVQSHTALACQAVVGGGTGEKAALPLEQDLDGGNARQRPSTSAGVAFDTCESCEPICCTRKPQPAEAQLTDAELEGLGLRGSSHARHADAAVAGGVDFAEPQTSRDRVDAEQNLADTGDECSGIDQGTVATSFWRRKRQKFGGVLDLWNRAAQRT